MDAISQLLKNSMYAVRTEDEQRGRLLTRYISTSNMTEDYGTLTLAAGTFTIGHVCGIATKIEMSLYTDTWKAHEVGILNSDVNADGYVLEWQSDSQIYLRRVDDAVPTTIATLYPTAMSTTLYSKVVVDITSTYIDVWVNDTLLGRTFDTTYRETDWKWYYEYAAGAAGEMQFCDVYSESVYFCSGMDVDSYDTGGDIPTEVSPSIRASNDASGWIYPSMLQPYDFGIMFSIKFTGTFVKLCVLTRDSYRGYYLKLEAAETTLYQVTGGLGVAETSLGTLGYTIKATGPNDRYVLWFTENSVELYQDNYSGSPILQIEEDTGAIRRKDWQIYLTSDITDLYITDMVVLLGHQTFDPSTATEYRSGLAYSAGSSGESFRVK